MYESHFGLKKRPFRALALGNDVFIGPQAAAVLAGIKKSLGSADAIVTVSGPVGGGKTTLVLKALGGMGDALLTISVGRIKLGYDEVLELLLQELGIEELPASTVQRFGLFRRILKKQADKGCRVCVVVEDTARIGTDALAELEALTAADAGVSDGANVVLMGDPALSRLLESQSLSRVRQRLRLRQLLEPLSQNELRAYLKHCFRLAGGEFDTIFVPESVALIHALTGGIVRMANNVTESALIAAAELEAKKVDQDTILRVAAQEYGLTADRLPDQPSRPASPPEVAVKPVPEPVTAPEPAAAECESAPEAVAKSESQPEAVATPEAEPEATPRDIPEPVILAPAPPAAAQEADPDDEIPELIQDTLPDLEVLAPQLARARTDPAPPTRPEATPTARPQPSKVRERQPAASVRPPADRARRPEPASKPDVVDIPTLTASPEADGPVDSGKDVPAWDRDPTLAELRPDLEALEHAMAIAQGPGMDDVPEPEVTPAADLRPRETPGAVPEITLDREIQAKIEEAAEAIKRTEAEAVAKAKADAEAAESIDIAATGEIRMEMELPPLRRASPPADATEPPPAMEPPPASAAARPQNKDMEQIAANLARAKTLDDVDDKMAETLFGEEFSAIAAQVAAQAANDGQGDDAADIPELTLEDEPSGDKADGQPPAPTAGSPSSAPRRADSPADAAGRAPGPGLDEAASQRLATVRALNGKANGVPPAPVGESIVLKHDNDHSQPPAAHGPIESIEDQINTSMTATLQALGGRPPSFDDDDEDGKKGFFSRFRKS